MRARGKEVYIITAVVAVVVILAWYFLLRLDLIVEVAELGARGAEQQEVPRHDEDDRDHGGDDVDLFACLLYTSPSPRDGLLSRMPSSA